MFEILPSTLIFLCLWRYAKHAPVTYVHTYYSTYTWREIYASDIMPVPTLVSGAHQAMLKLGLWGLQKTLSKQDGRRERGLKEGSRQRMVGCVLDATKHDITQLGVMCLSLSQQVEVGCIQSGVKCSRKPKKCGICGVLGHIRRKCQDLCRFD